MSRALIALENQAKSDVAIRGKYDEPVEYFRRIQEFRQQHNLIGYNFLFFYDHPRRRIPWFIAFNISNFVHNTLILHVLGETQEQEKPLGVTYFEQWYAETDTNPVWLAGSILYNFDDHGEYSEIWLEELLPINYGAAIAGGGKVEFETTLVHRGDSQIYRHSRSE
jgi:hypothetical protein